MNFPPQPPQSSCEMSRTTARKSASSPASSATARSNSAGFRHFDPQTAHVLEMSGAVIGMPVAAQFSVAEMSERG